MAITKKQVIAKLSITEAQAALAQAIEREKKLSKKRNAEFRAMPDDRKRVVIAQDVLAQIEMKRLVPTYGTYLTVPSECERKFGEYEFDELQLNDALSGTSCQVCGIGSIFVAAIDRANGCTVGEMTSASDDEFMREYLSNWFSAEQLDLIETAFEGRVVSENVNHHDKKVMRALRFTQDVVRPATRLRKIMDNILKNQGEFVP